MVTSEERFNAWNEWNKATEAFRAACFPPVGQEMPPLDERRRLAQVMTDALNRFKAIDGY